MEFEDEHDEEQEEEDDEDEITIPPPAVPPSYVDSVTMGGGLNSSAQQRVTRVNPSPISDNRRSGSVRYRECLKNHAVNIGGHAVDGCGEFMAAGEDGTLDALKCAACNCHRNFHRKEVDLSGGGGDVVVPQLTSPPPPNTGSGNAGVAGTTTMYPQFSAYYRTPAPPSGYLHVSSHHRPLPALPSSNTSGGTHSGDDMSHPSSSGGGRDSGGGIIMMGSGGNSKKRHRTKFTQEQKDKMLAFAEKVGWRIQKHDEAAVQQFCAEVQVKRQVLKVWMHNNKHTLGKKP